VRNQSWFGRGDLHRRTDSASATPRAIPLSAFEHLDGAGAGNIAKMHGVPVPSARSILLLDDDPDVGIAAQLLLQRRVAAVHCLRRPGELIATLDRFQPALLLLDLNFGPGRSDGSQGLRLLDEVQAQRNPPPVVVLTAYGDIDLAVRALKRGAFDFIVKPWDNARLVATCQEAMKIAIAPRDERTTASTPVPVQSLAAQERAAVLAAMADAHGNLSAAARALGLSRAALYRRLEKYGL
jgi:DNA-binding NtrC family response regulator